MDKKESLGKTNRFKELLSQWIKKIDKNMEDRAKNRGCCCKPPDKKGSSCCS